MCVSFQVFCLSFFFFTSNVSIVPAGSSGFTDAVDQVDWNRFSRGSQENDAVHLQNLLELSVVFPQTLEKKKRECGHAFSLVGGLFHVPLQDLTDQNCAQMIFLCNPKLCSYLHAVLHTIFVS